MKTKKFIYLLFLTRKLFSVDNTHIGLCWQGKPEIFLIDIHVLMSPF